MFANLLLLSTSSHIFVLCAILLAPKFLTTELSSPFIVLLGLLVVFFGKVRCGYLNLIWPFFGVLFIGLLNIVDHESRHILRDISFAMTPISLIFIGWWLASREILPSILKIIVVFGFTASLIHLSFFIFNPELLASGSMAVRSVAGSSGGLATLALVISLFQKYFGINDLFPRWLPRIIATPVLSASFVFSYSRTEFLVVLVLSLAMLGVLSKINSRMIFTVFMLVSGFFILTFITPKDEVGTFRSKLIRSVNEIAISDYRDMSDINHNWRGFESYRAWALFASGNATQQMFGRGFGTVVDLGFHMPLGENVFRYIPVLHNGYIYVLVKVGLVGLVCYVIFYISIIKTAFRYSNSLLNAPKILARLLLGCSLSLALNMYVVGGMAQFHSTELVMLVGYLAGRLGQWRADECRINAKAISGRRRIHRRRLSFNYKY